MKIDHIRKYCMSFPEATENLQWGDDLCFKVRGKIFVTLALRATPQKLCFKCRPESFAELIERNDIRPAPYVGRFRWVILGRRDALRFDELKDFIRLSYEMVSAKAPKAKKRSRGDPSPPRLRKIAFAVEYVRPETLPRLSAFDSACFARLASRVPCNSGWFSIRMRLPHKSALSALVLVVGVACPALAATQPTHAEHAIVVSVHELASQAGVEIMQAGGNAVDAAVATGFALAVVHPAAGNIGGGGFLLLRMADSKTHFLDYREKAPAAATREMYQDAQGNVVKGASEFGYKAIGVPGSVAGMVYAEQKWGKLTLKQVMAPAIKLAKDGYALNWEQARDLHDPHLAEFAESRRVFQRNGDYYKVSEIFRQPDLARTLERIAANPDNFYHGALAHELAAAIKKGGGLITVDDLAHYEVKEREPMHGTYRGYEVVSAPPPSSGGTVLIESLNILEGYDLAGMGNRSAQSIHTTTEAFRRAFFDRTEFMGDPDFSRIPVAQLIDKKYAAAWRDTIDPSHASASKELKRPAIFSELEQYAVAHPPALPAYEPDHTTHYSVVDAEGNAVAVTTTINGWFGSRVTADGLGFLLNDEMDDFSSKPGVPNSDGLIQGAANAIAPGKRPLSSMTPTIVVHDGKTVMVLGSPGSSKIITTVANVLTGVVDYGMNIQEAVNAPRFHNQWLPDVLNVEKWFSPDTLAALRQLGHTIQVGVRSGDSSGYWSDAECIAIDEKTGERLGATDGRDSNAKAVGY
jgi:gamma-glutamyltranspeptidase / glutathione hydrolase